MVKRILHGWKDEECRQLLATMYWAAPPHGRVLIMEHVVPGLDTPHFSKLALQAQTPENLRLARITF